MENVSKALLIAAAVLIVILIIAFSMRIFNSTSDVSSQAADTGKMVSDQANQAATAANTALGGLSGWMGTTTTE